MNIARSLVKLHQQNVGKSFHRKYRYSAANFNSAQSSQPQVAEEKFSFEDLKVFERKERRKAAIPPFIKGIFVSTFNNDLLAYPEILNKDESEAIDRRVSALDNVFSNQKNSLEDRINILKSTKMYAAPVSLTNNGLAMNLTESLRYLEVITDINLSKQLSEHWVGLEAIKHGLTSEEYQQVIGDLISGDHTISFCLKENLSERVLQVDLRTTAEPDEQGIWRITGEKICSTTDGYYLVLCCIESVRMKLFLVHPGVAGVGHKDGKVTFRKTPGTPLNHSTDAQMSQILGQARLHSATIIRGVLKRAMDECIAFVRTKFRGGKPLSETPTFRKVLGDALTDIYASESSDYFTAGLADGYMDPDVEIEMAMCRNFMAKRGLAHINNIIAIFCQENESLSEDLSLQMRKLTMYAESTESVDVFIALNGIHHAGKMMAEEIKHMRNPVFHPGFIFKKILQNRHQEKDDPKLNLRLFEYLHPTMIPQATFLEYCTVRMRYASETLMSRHGQEIAEHHTELIRLAEAATGVLAMTAVLGRASRAYCIGLRNAELEMKLASCFTTRTKDEVKNLILALDEGEYLNLDHYILNFGQRLLDNKNGQVEKPTARVYW